MKRKLLLGSLTVILVGAVAAIGYMLIMRSSDGLPSNIKKQINFTVYIPANSGDQPFALDAPTLEYSKSSGTLALTAIGEGTKVIVTQQALPGAFTDIPQYYEKLLDKLHQYDEIDTAIGKVTLTHPDELKGGQSGVSRAGGTLMFAHPERNLTTQEWKQFYDSLEVVK